MARGSGRSFAALVGLGAAFELGGMATALLGLDTLARCYLPSPSGRASLIPMVCMKAIPAVGFHLFVPVALLIALLFSTAVFGVMQAARSFRSSRHLKRSLGPVLANLPDNLSTAALGARAKRVELRQDEESYGACIGILRPRVVVSTALLQVLGDDELVAVLAHEERHRRRRAPLRRLLARITMRALFFLPVLGDLFSSHLVEEEVVADQESVALAGKLPLVQALAKLSDLAHTEDVALAFGDISVLSYRLRALQDGTTTRSPLGRRRIAASVAALSTLVLLVLWMPMSGVR